MKPHYTNTANPVDFPKMENMMNERIRLLAEQAHIPFKDENSFDCLVFSKEKFAELIVFECVKLAVFRGDPATGRAIQEHFGVEL